MLSNEELDYWAGMKALPFSGGVLAMPEGTLHRIVNQARQANTLKETLDLALESFADVCKELGCERDNEEALLAIDTLKQENDRLAKEWQASRDNTDHARSDAHCAKLQLITLQQENDRLRKALEDTIEKCLYHEHPEYAVFATQALREEK